MTKIGQVLAVCIAVASVAFMAFAVASTVAGPNWSGDEGIQSLPDYLFELAPGTPETPPTWSVKRRRTQESVPPSTPILGHAVLTARRDLTKKQIAQIAEFDSNINSVPSPVMSANNGNPATITLAEKIALSEKANADDVKGMRTRETEMVAEYKALQAEITAIFDKIIATTLESQTTRAEADRRREDVFRLQNQIEEIYTDRYRAIEQQKKLRDLLVRLRGSIARAQRRENQIKNLIYDETPGGG